jgi:hypothetical protein
MGAGWTNRQIEVQVVPNMTDLPYEVLLNIFKFAFRRNHCDPLIDSVKRVTSLGAASTIFRELELGFWALQAYQTFGSHVQVLFFITR